MAVNFELTGPAEIGDLKGWTVQEAATQSSPVETINLTPSLSVVGKTETTTKFAAHNDVKITHPTLGSVEGYVRSVNPVGVNSSLDCQTVLNQLNVDAEFSETYFPTGLLSDYVGHIVGGAVQNPPVPPPDPDAGLVWTSSDTLPPPTSGWACATYGAGVFVAVRPGSSVTSPDGVTWTLSPPVLNFAPEDIVFGNGVFVAATASWGHTIFTSTDGLTWADGGGFGYLFGITFGNGMFVAVGDGKTQYSYDGVTWYTTTTSGRYWADVAFGDGLFVAVDSGLTSAPQRIATSVDGITWAYNSSLSTQRWSGIVFGGNRFVAYDQTYSVSATSTDGITWTSSGTLSSTNRVGTYTDMAYGAGRFVIVGTGGSNRMVYSTDGISWSAVSITPNFGPVTFGLGLFVALSALAVTVYRSGALSPPFTNWDATTDPIDAYIPWSGNIWQMLNNLLMLNNVELVYTNNELVIRDIGSVIMEFDDRTVVNRQITAVDARQSVEVAYREAYEQTGTIYDAYQDGNKVYSINANEYREDKVVYEVPLTHYDVATGKNVQYGTITNVPLALDQPIEAAYGTVRPVAGQYILSASDGLPLAQNQFSDYGGKIEVRLNPEDPFSFLLVWNGPVQDIPGAPGPYSLQVYEYGTLSVTGSAIYAVNKKINVSTGADPEIVTDATPLELTIPFVNSKYQAFSVGAAAGRDLFGTTEELSFDIATNALSGFGVTQGAIFRYDNVFWRLTSANIHGATTSITARYHTTFDQVDESWSGLTYGAFDAVWDTYKYKDFRIEPLRNSLGLPHLYPALTLYPATTLFPA